MGTSFMALDTPHNYKIHYNQIIGEGCSRVVQATHKVTGDVKAAKVININNDPEKRDVFFNEAQMLQYLNSLSCENIVQLSCSSIHNQVGSIIMEKMDYDLLDLILDNTLSDQQKKDIFRQICIAIKQCHDNNVAHLDVKPENVLVNISESGDIKVKLADFGGSQRMDNGFVYGVKGTIHYNAPEVFTQTQQGLDGRAADAWSLGILLHVLLTGTWPIQTNDPIELRALLAKGKLHLSEALSKEQMKFITSLLQMHPIRRPTIDKILQSPFVKERRRKKTFGIARRLFT